MTAWILALIAMLPPLSVAVAVALRSDIAGRLVALQFAASIALVMLVLMSFAFDQPSFVDLPLTLVFLSLPGTLVFAHFLERWL